MTPTKTAQPSQRKAAPNAKPDRPRSARSVDPRIRQRRAAVTRHQGRRRLYFLLCLIGLSILIVLAWYVLHSSLLSAKVITVEGSTHTSDAAIIAASGLNSHTPLIDITGGSVASRIEALPWVLTATVTRHWPDGVSIAITESSPIAVVADGTSGFAEIDARGRVLADVATAPVDMVRLVVPGTLGAVGSTLSSAAGPGLTVASNLPIAFRTQVTTITVASDGTVNLSFTTPITAELGTTSQLQAKYEDIASLLAGATLHPGDALDVSVPDSPTVTGP